MNTWNTFFNDVITNKSFPTNDFTDFTKCLFFPSLFGCHGFGEGGLEEGFGFGEGFGGVGFHGVYLCKLRVKIGDDALLLSKGRDGNRYFT